MKRRGTIVLLSAGIAGLLAGGVLHHLLHRTPGDHFDSSGTPIYFYEVGEGEPVILLHGFGVNGDLNWRLTGVVNALAPQYRVIVMDLRGHGLSGKPTDPASYGAAMAEDAVRLMDHLGIERAHVAGFSLGGYAGLKLATTHPERLQSLACMGAGWLDPDDPGMQGVLAGFQRLADQLESGQGVEPIAELFGEGRHQATWFHRQQVRFVTTFLGDKEALAAMLRGIEGLSVSGVEVAAIAVPMIAICGDRDPNYLSAQRLHEAHPACDLITLENTSHPGAAASAELREALVRFLASHSMSNED